MLGTGPCCKVGAALADELERQGWADSMDLRQIHAQHAIKRGPDLEVRRVHLPSFDPDFGEAADIVPLVDFERLERDLQLAIAFEDFDLVKVVQRQRLAECKDVLISPVSRQGGANGSHGRVATDVAHFRQRDGRTFPGHNGPDDPHACDTGDVGDDMMELHIHLHQRLLHVLDMGGGIFDQPLTLP